MKKISPLWKTRIVNSIDFTVKIVALPLWFAWHITDEILPEEKEDDNNDN